jgi:inorganic pyrophosphatase
MVAASLPARVEFVIEVPKGGFIKWGADGAVDYLSPLPCPFNYGSALNYHGEDGDPADVVVLGRRRSGGSSGELPVWGRVRFVDQGQRDDKVDLC